MSSNHASRPLSIPVMLGTVRQGRQSVHAARWVTQHLAGKAGVETELIDIATLPLTTADAGEATKDPALSETLARADGLVIVTPEYNRSIPGLLKHVLDGYLKEYIHKAVGVVGVSAGRFGGVRAIENMLPMLRELGLVTIFWDVNIGPVSKVFGDDGQLLDPGLITPTDKFLAELIWMARTLRYGRESIPLESA
jgi:NAD(P)H-dependent FMN reductase